MPSAVPPLLSRQQLFPGSGVPLHVNRPRHAGEVPLHRHDFAEIAIVAGGTAVHRSLHGTGLLRTGDVLVLPAGAWHAYERCDDLRLANCCIGADLLNGTLSWVGDDPEIATLLAGSATPEPLLRLPNDALARTLTLMDRIVTVQSDAQRHRLDLIGLLLEVLGELSRAMPPAVRRRGAAHPGIRAIMADLSHDPAKAWSLADLARRAQLDRSYLVRLFRRQTGLSPMDWLTRLRGERAAILLLTTHLPIADVGAKVGWADPTYFARRFRTLFHQTPGDYRRHLPTAPLDAAPQGMQVDDWVQW
jgi:AraC family transcriptional regulator, L-rhamnose operon transcriptional activator RhaR